MFYTKLNPRNLKRRTSKGNDVDYEILDQRTDRFIQFYWKKTEYFWRSVIDWGRLLCLCPMSMISTETIGPTALQFWLHLHGNIARQSACSTRISLESCTLCTAETHCGSHLHYLLLFVLFMLPDLAAECFQSTDSTTVTLSALPACFMDSPKAN